MATLAEITLTSSWQELGSGKLLVGVKDYAEPKAYPKWAVAFDTAPPAANSTGYYEVGGARDPVVNSDATMKVYGRLINAADPPVKVVVTTAPGA